MRTVESMRERFRENLVGIWATSSFVPMGDLWQFNADGTGHMVEYRGFGGTKFELLWLPLSDWKIQMTIERPKGYWDEWYEHDDEGLAQPVEEPWFTVAYEFRMERHDYSETACLFAWTEDYDGPEDAPGGWGMSIALVV